MKASLADPALMRASYRPSRPVYLCLHVCAINDYREIMEHILRAVANSGLLSIVAAIYYCVAGEGTDVVAPLLRQYAPSVPAHLWACEAGRFKYERLTLHRLADMARQAPDLGQEFFVLYLHSKGVTKPSEHKHKIYKWREMMLHFLADRWPLCLTALEGDPVAWGCSVVG